MPISLLNLEKKLFQQITLIVVYAKLLQATCMAIKNLEWNLEMNKIKIKMPNPSLICELPT